MVLDRLGKYEIIGLLGGGSMGKVYKAFDPLIRRTVAIKTIRKELLEHHEASAMLARFKNEAQAAGRLSHPGITSIYDYGDEESVAYIVMEYVQGNGLDEYFKRGTRFSVQDLISIMVQLLDALDFAHEQGIVHRDVKPSNLMVMNNGRLKVADFGIARIDTSDLTQVGMIMGTPGYMAPEQYVDSDIDRRADIFAAGVIFYQLLAGVKPFTGNMDLICHKIRNEDPVLPSQVDPARDLFHFDSVVLKALAKKPAQRYESAKAFRDAILAAHQDTVSLSLSEETIIESSNAVPGGNDQVAALRTTMGSMSTGTTGYPSGWDVDLLIKIEKRLTKVVGPVARVMIKRAAKLTLDVNELYELIGNELENVPDRTMFLASRNEFAQSSISRIDTTNSNQILPDFIPIGDDQMERATRQLASFLGPIAKILVKKAASKAKNPENFYMLLSENLSTDKEKQSFLQTMSK